MGQFGQTNDLQEAIDQVSNNSKNGKAKKDSAKTDNLDQIQTQLGVPPMPEPFPAPENAAPFSDILPPSDGAASAPVTAPAPVPGSAPSAPIDIVNHAQPAIRPEDANKVENAPAPEAAPETTPAAAPSAEQILSEALSSNAAENTDLSDIAKVREDILRELMPLMDEVESTPEQKFEIYREAIDSLNDKSLIGGAYKVASQMTDKSKKANSLMELMQEINKM